MSRNLLLSSHMTILRPIETRWPTRTNPILPQRSNSLLFQRLVRVEVVEIVARQIRD